MTFLQSLLTWANLPFMAAVASTLTFALIQATGLLSVSDGEGDGDSDAAHGDGDSDHDHHGALHDAATTAADAGRLPTTILWQTFAMTFGMVGVVANTGVLLATGGVPVTALVLSLPAGVVGGLTATRLVTRLLGRFIRPGVTAAGRRHLVGLPGIVVSERVDEEFGEVRLRAPHGDFVQVACRVLPGERTIQHHESVVVARFDGEQDFLYVAPVEAESDERPESLRLRA